MMRVKRVVRALFLSGLVVTLLAFASVSRSASTCLVDTGGVVSLWPADGDTSDIVGGNDGTLRNGAGFAAGKVGQAFNFDGQDDFVEVLDSAAFTFDVGTSVTVAAWVLALTPPRALGVSFVDHSAPGNTDNSGFSLNSLYFSVNDAFGAGVRAGYAFPGVGEWVHLTGVHDRAAGRTRIYLNGVLAREVAASEGVIDGALSLLIGTGPERGFAVLHGRIDEVAILNRAVSPSEIPIVAAGGACDASVAIGVLISQVMSIGLDLGRETSSTSKLEQAQKSLARGNQRTAKGQLRAFVNEVEAIERGGQLGATTADAFTSAAQLIIAAF